jgi:hypothetical protein
MYNTFQEIAEGAFEKIEYACYLSSLKLLLKEHPQLEVITILNDPQPTVELQDVAGYIIICKKKD